MQVLVVRQAFADFGVGEIIRDPAAISAVREAGQAHFCSATNIDESFFADAPKTKAAAPAVEA